MKVCPRTGEGSTAKHVREADMDHIEEVACCMSVILCRPPAREHPKERPHWSQQVNREVAHNSRGRPIKIAEWYYRQHEMAGSSHSQTPRFVLHNCSAHCEWVYCKSVGGQTNSQRYQPITAGSLDEQWRSGALITRVTAQKRGKSQKALWGASSMQTQSYFLT